MMIRISNVVPFLMMISLFIIVWGNNMESVVAASGKNDKDHVNEGNDDDRSFGETEFPTSAPMKTMDDNDNSNTRFTVSPISSPTNQGPNNNPTSTTTTTTNAPATAPVAADDNSDSTTEDMDEDDEATTAEETLQNQLKESCRAMARGMAITTNTSIQLIYNFEILTTTGTPLYTGIAVNNAVTNFLREQYIQPYCNTGNTTNKNVRQRRQLRLRSLQSGGSNNATRSSTQFAAGDVRGVVGGTTTVVKDNPCYVPVEDTGIVACYRLQSSTTIHFRNDYITTDKDGLPMVDEIETNVFTDISTAFSDDTIQKSVVEGGETGLQSTNYLSGTVGEISVKGESKERSSNSASDRNSSRGLTRAGKAFLTLFLLCLIFVMCYFGYKYGYPKLKERYPNIKERLTRPRNVNTTTESHTDRSFCAESSNPFVAMYERFQQRKVPKEVNRPYDFIASDSKLDRITDRNVLISDTIESSSTDGGYGTEMILDDLQEEEIRLSPKVSTPSSQDYRFTPSTLPNSKEYERKVGKRLVFDRAVIYEEKQNESVNDDAFSFSDVNIIIDDSSSYATGNGSITQRPYLIPDTVNI